MSRRFSINFPSQRLLSTGALLGAVVLGSAGCDEITRQKECEAAIDVINAGQTVMAKDGSHNDQKAGDEHAKEVEDYAKTIGDVKITDVELKQHVEAFHKNIVDLAKFLRDFYAGVGDFAANSKRVNEIDEEREKLVETINGYCSRK